MSKSVGDEYDVSDTRTLAQLDSQADRLRTDLAGVRLSIAGAQQGAKAIRAELLKEANAQLVLAALHAETIAEAAVRNLDELARVGQRDVLTDTPNRAMMLDRVTGAIAMAQRHQSHVAVLFLDLDDFKRINDTYGHAVGDEVLRMVARRLESAVRHSDTVSRHGGDEFLVLLSEIPRASDASLIAMKIASALSELAQVGEHVLHLSASIGISIYPEDGDDAITLIRNADAAMYLAKRRAHGGFQFHSPHVEGIGDTGVQWMRTLATLASDQETLPAGRACVRELQEANERLVMAAVVANEQRVQRESALRSQVEFQAKVAHEMRGQLTPIRIAADMLRRAAAGALLPGQLHDTIETQVLAINVLIDDLVANSMSSLGKFRLARQHIDLCGVLEVAIEKCRSEMEAKGQQVRVRMPVAPMVVNGDRMRLVQIFSNLLQNASRYTAGAGEIAIEVEHFVNAVQVSISDTGIGIEAEALPTIFDLFVRARPAFGVHTEGTGIGLAVVRELVDAHDGTVRATSAGVNLGSKFDVTLPLVPGQACAKYVID